MVDIIFFPISIKFGVLGKNHSLHARTEHVLEGLEDPNQPTLFPFYS